MAVQMARSSGDSPTILKLSKNVTLKAKRVAKT